MAKILVVDDSMTVLISLKRLLEENGHEVVAAHDGLTTLSTVISNTPDIILLDIGLPGVSGLDLCVAIKHMPAYASIPVIVITGSRRQFDEILAQKIGVQAYLQKPVDPQKLLDLIAQHVPHHNVAGGIHQLDIRPVAAS
jgi:DNA-binding response OmpR family regulator